jgi:cytochrome b561
VPDVSEQQDDALVARPLQSPQDKLVEIAADPAQEEHGTDPGHTRPAGGYTKTQRRLHWIVAALVVLQLIGGLTIGVLHYALGKDPLIGKLLIGHLANGTLIFGLMCARLMLRRRLGAPALPAGTSYDVALLSRLNHYGFYALLLIMPILGWTAYLSSGSLHSLAGGIHASLALVLALAIGAHLAGVVYHTYIRKDGLLRRMWA